MRVLRGRADTLDADRRASESLLEYAAAGEPAVRVWRPHRQVAFGRRDRRQEGYDEAYEAARDHGFAPIERSVGGRAVAYDGETALAFARADPVEDFRRGTDARYERATEATERALSELGVDTERGEPADAFCPGSHSVSARLTAAGGNRDPTLGKLVGLAQRVRQDAALTSGIVLVDNRELIGTVLESVYGALGLAFDPDSVGTIAAAGGEPHPAVVRARFEEALIGDVDSDAVTVESVPVEGDGGPADSGQSNGGPAAQQPRTDTADDTLL
ncbi:lipoate--protein ligase family protein [Natrialba sp. SSL1]|uniref:lipoate--protein ligase family protein n=1 Tax=Natrialba sp. SSL1 TaxID=1869245 RepID=UPI0008F9563E|nr:lipoate--protein ligase family protein [Natrialba sp. SSL1]OIB55673.1 lipoate--protein ligase [Natrialba sp. SSL1]